MGASKHLASLSGGLLALSKFKKEEKGAGSKRPHSYSSGAVFVSGNQQAKASAPRRKKTILLPNHIRKHLKEHEYRKSDIWSRMLLGR